MTVRKLIPQEIDNLFELCEFYKVFHYDVQIELVDHIASAIEALWKTNPELPFEEAAFMVGEQFGGKPGFKSIKEAKEIELRKKYNRLKWKYIGEFFKLPKIILTLVLILTLYTSLHYLDQRQVILIISASILVIFFLLFSTLDNFTNKFKITLKDYEKSFLILSYFNQIKLRINRIGSVLYFVMLLFFKPFRAHQTALFDMLGSTLIVLLFISFYALMFYMPKLVKQHFTEQFPQFVKS